MATVVGGVVEVIQDVDMSGSMDVPLYSIVVPVFNQWKYTEQCLQALEQHTVAEPYEIIVVDNGSSDATASNLPELVSANPNIHLLRFESNRGFSQACNAGAELAQGKYLVFLNNDTIVGENWLSPLISYLNNNLEVGIVGPKLVDPLNNTINHGGYVYSRTLGGMYGIYQGISSKAPCVNREREFAALLGACFVLEKSLFESVGMFSDFGLEDIDLCLKVRSSGRRVVYVPESEVGHYGSVTIKGSRKDDLPEMSTEEFNQIWKSIESMWDDTRYYSEDGFTAFWKDEEHLILEHRENGSYYLLYKAIEELESDNAKVAQELLRSAINCDPSNSGVFSLAASVAWQNNQQQEALHLLEQLIELSPQNLEALVVCCEMCAMLGYTSKAVELLDQLSRINVLPIELRAEYGALCEAVGKMNASLNM